MGKTENATLWMENLANDNSHGYLYGEWGPVDYDCGHAIITAWELAGVPVKTRGATYTGNMASVFMSCGFKDVTMQVDRRSGSGMMRGDVLLNTAEHAAMYIGNGKLVHARSSEGNTIPGDQSGNEIRIQPYFNWVNGGWNYVLRFGGNDSDIVSNTIISQSDLQNNVSTIIYKNSYSDKCNPDVPVIKIGCAGIAVAMAQKGLILTGKKYNIREASTILDDGDFGPLSVAATNAVRRYFGLNQTGIIDSEMWQVLLK